MARVIMLASRRAFLVKGVSKFLPTKSEEEYL